MITMPAGMLQVARVARPSRSSLSVRAQAQLGDKVLPLIRKPADLLFLGPRLALGALLSANENLERLPEDLERLATLATDPRPLDAKRDDVLVEVESRVATFLQRGLGAENEVIASVAEALPQEVKDALPAEVREALLTPREVPGAGGAEAWAASAGNGTAGQTGPTATWTISSMDEDDAQFPQFPVSASPGGGEEVDDGPPATAATVAASQVAAELVEIQAAVVAVQGRLSDLQSNTDDAKRNILKLNVKEAAAGLATRLRQRAPTPAGADATVTSAVAEAEALLGDVEALL